jgi:putative transposase
VVDRRFVFEELEREQFRMFLRMQENFSGCRVLSYCVMSNHFHILLELPPMPENGISDDELLKRLGAIYTEAFVATVAKELMEARKTENQRLVDEIHARFTYRMHDLGEFMKTLPSKGTGKITLGFSRRCRGTGTANSRGGWPAGRSRLRPNGAGCFPGLTGCGASW